MYLVLATKLLPVCRPSVAGYKGIQVDRDNSNYVAKIQSSSIPDEQLVSGYMCPSTYTCIAIRIQVASPGYMCPGINTALE